MAADGFPEPEAAPALAALVVGAVWVAGWSVATVGAMRRAPSERPKN